jgi:hypothetical protein
MSQPVFCLAQKFKGSLRPLGRRDRHEGAAILDDKRPCRRTLPCSARILCWTGSRLDQAGIASDLDVSTVLAGMIPKSFCRAKVSSRSLSQPASNMPLNQASQSAGAWAGHGRRLWDNRQGTACLAHSLFADEPSDGIVSQQTVENCSLGWSVVNSQSVAKQSSVLLIGIADDEVIEIFET